MHVNSSAVQDENVSNLEYDPAWHYKWKLIFAYFYSEKLMSAIEQNMLVIQMNFELA